MLSPKKKAAVASDLMVLMRDAFRLEIRLSLWQLPQMQTNEIEKYRPKIVLVNEKTKL